MPVVYGLTSCGRCIFLEELPNFNDQIILMLFSPIIESKVENLEYGPYIIDQYILRNTHEEIAEVLFQYVFNYNIGKWFYSEAGSFLEVKETDFIVDLGFAFE